jgi:hypothetical protein
MGKWFLFPYKDTTVNGGLSSEINEKLPHAVSSGRKILPGGKRLRKQKIISGVAG